MHRAGVEQNAVTYGIYHRAVLDAKWPTPARQRAIEAWAQLRLFVQALIKLKACIRTDTRSLCPPTTDSYSVSDGGYHSDKTAEEKRLEALELETKPYVISYHSLQENKEKDPLSSTNDEVSLSKSNPLDPLGALASSETPKAATHSNQLPMSPSRAKFMAELQSTPFASELNPKAENKVKVTPNKSLGWLKGITNSPIMKMIRSQTFENQKDEENDPGLTMSPSLHSLVNQVWKGYDDVRMDAVSSKLKLGVSSLVREVKSLNRSYRERGSGTLFGDDSDDEIVDIDEEDPAYQLDCGKADSILSDEWWLKEVFLQLRRNEMRKADTNEKTHYYSGSKFVDVTLSSCTSCPTCRTMIYDEEIMSGWKVDDQNLNTACPYCCSAEEAPHDSERKGVFAPRLTVHLDLRDQPLSSWYSPSCYEGDTDNNTDESELENEDVCVSFVSPLVLRREVETLLANDLHALKDPKIMSTHPVVFWNLVYYLRRLSLPTHLYT
ncbi:unnamed protein product [Strongylus vulgaris]|uniref:Uncharacterized protein n=1 Tax=Strongylus vulgaris TaxID=40348 RepID=A0A3P7K1U4_STRVU|nr:unnamed protein product [Strongylus vulgaris]